MRRSSPEKAFQEAFKALSIALEQDLSPQLRNRALKAQQEVALCLRLISEASTH